MPAEAQARVRVVSLVPSLTETVLAWERAGEPVEVVACTRFCEQPAIRHVGGTKDPDVRAIVALDPDVVLVDREENRLPDAEALRAAGMHVHDTHVTSLADVAPALAGVRQACRLEATAPFDLGTAVASTSTVLVPIWQRPWMALGPDTYGSTLLAHLGWSCVLPPGPDRYPTIHLIDILVERRPDLVLLPSEPYPFRRRHLDAVRAEAATASPTTRVELVDGQDLLWWGVRTAAALRRLSITRSST
jgi:ABC-type hemin transport system substrate-binding protein